MKTKQDLYAARPTSPHLTIYRPQISSVLSIFHRITGAFLFGTLSIVTWVFILHVFGIIDCCSVTKGICTSFIKATLSLISFTFFYHISTGIRHLIWDMGYAMSKKGLHISGWIAIFIAIIASILFSYCIIF